MSLATLQQKNYLRAIFVKLCGIEPYRKGREGPPLVKNQTILIAIHNYFFGTMSVPRTPFPQTPFPQTTFPQNDP
jgi:hypothetical protein